MMSRVRSGMTACVLLVVLGAVDRSRGGDWPMWRYDSARGAASPHALPAKLTRQWSRRLPRSQPAWPETQTKLQFDAFPQPVVAGHRILVPSNATDTVTAYDTRSGHELWRFYADAPVRFAPVAWDGSIFFVSDDGHLYCLDSAGKLNWKFNGGPGRRSVLGNRRLVSSWPARGGPVLHEDRVFFAASIWPFMGIFIHAVDPHTGAALWTNSGDGTNYTVHPHNAPSFGTVVPQGHLAAVDDALIVPGGRSTPAVYDASSGALRHFEYDKKAGGHDVTAARGSYFVAGATYSLANGERVAAGRPVVADDRVLVYVDGDEATGLSADSQATTRTVRDRRGAEAQQRRVSRQQLFKTTLHNLPGKVFIKAGENLYAAGAGRVAAYQLPEGGGPVWSDVFEGEAASMLAGDGRLFVVTDKCVIHCFGADPVEAPVLHNPQEVALPEVDNLWSEVAEPIHRQIGGDGYALAMGIGTGDLIGALLARTRLYVVAIDPDASKVDAFRRRMTVAGHYGSRVSALAGDPASFPFPPYFANLLVSEDPVGNGLVTSDGIAACYRSLRPYGGAAVWGLSAAEHPTLVSTVKALNLPNATVRQADGLTWLVREGALPGSDDWTHQYANAAQTVASRDQLVKAPLGILWFGGASHEGVLPRHGHGPSPQVAGGRVIIEGADMLRAVDVYTGRVLWQISLPGLGTFYDNTSHQPGAGEVGSNYVTLADRIYVVYGTKLLELDARTGDHVRQLELQGSSDEPPNWGSLSVCGNYLVATSSPVAVGKSSEQHDPLAGDTRYRNLIARHETWRYLAGSEPAAGWANVEFDDSEWKSGVVGIGYGDNDDRTVLRDMKGRYQRVYARRQFDGKTALKAARLGLMVNYDDGFVAYLNGKEILRRNVKGDGASASVSSHEAGGYEFFELSDFQSLLRAGANVLALVGHNVRLDSSDFTLDPYLVYVPDRADAADAPRPTPTAPGMWRRLPKARHAPGSRRMVVFDRTTGRQLWERDAVFNFRHNNIAVTDDRVFCIDRLTEPRSQALARRGIEVEGTPKLHALDIRTGRVLWSTDRDVFGTFLSYHAEYDTLIQAGSRFRDRASDETGTGIVAYRGTDGRVLWANRSLDYGGPCVLWRDKVLTNGSGGFALDIKTGQPTGWSYSRNYGCNTAIGSDHLLTFRSGAAGFYDLLNDSGTGNLGGFKSSCTSNLIPANGVLNAPDYTRTCSCAYQNQTSLALVHMPEAEFWTFGGKLRQGRLGVNLGAPGDRRVKSGTLWLDVPSRGGSSDKVTVRFEPEFPELFRHHASFVRGGPVPWVAASGARGLTRLALEAEDGNYQVNLVFLEPESIKRGERVFDVSIQGQCVETDFDIVRAAGGAHRSVIRSYGATSQDGKIAIELTAKTKLSTVLSGVELIAK
jgi:outer membrane protein assembly factor BamB